MWIVSNETEFYHCVIMPSVTLLRDRLPWWRVCTCWICLFLVQYGAYVDNMAGPFHGLVLLSTFVPRNCSICVFYVCLVLFDSYLLVYFYFCRYLRCSPFDELKVWKRQVDNKTGALSATATSPLSLIAHSTDINPVDSQMIL